MCSRVSNGSASSPAIAGPTEPHAASRRSANPICRSRSRASGLERRSARGAPHRGPAVESTRLRRSPGGAHRCPVRRGLGRPRAFGTSYVTVRPSRGNLRRRLPPRMQGRAFRFEPLLEARRRDETRAWARYAGLRDAASTVRRGRDESLRVLDDARARAFDVPERGLLRDWQAYLGVLGRRSLAAQQPVTVSEGAAAAAREELVRASRARAVLELLRDRRRDSAARARGGRRTRTRRPHRWRRATASA